MGHCNPNGKLEGHCKKAINVVHPKILLAGLVHWEDTKRAHSIFPLEEMITEINIFFFC